MSGFIWRDAAAEAVAAVVEAAAVAAVVGAAAAAGVAAACTCCRLPYIAVAASLLF